ncbi:MAG: AsmA-like C-terminal region-containing protein, partial [Ghiorsea sp.]
LTLKLEDLRLTMSAEKGVVRINPVRFDIGNGHVAENFILNAKNYPVTWQESLRMSGVQVLPVLKAVADLDMLSGIAELSTDMKGKGLLPDHMMKSVKGNGKFSFADGQVKGVNIAKEIRKLQGSSDAKEQNSTDFAQMQGSFRVSKGVVSNNDLYMASPLFRLSGKGKLYLDPLHIDYRVRPKLIGSLAGQGGGSQKGLVVPLHISGPFDDLDISVEMDRDSLLESAAALNKLSGNHIGGVAGKALDQGFVKTRDEEVKKTKEKLQAKLAAEKIRLQQQAEANLKKQAEDKLKNALKGFGF